MKEVIDCNRIGMAVIGLEVPHTHIHLVPLDQIDDINFSKPKIKLSDERMQEIAVLYKEYSLVYIANYLILSGFLLIKLFQLL